MTALRHTVLCLTAIASWSLSAHAQDASPEAAKADTVLEESLAHVQRFEARLADDADAELPLFEKPLLRFGDSARANDRGTVWAFGTGRPQAIIELYQGVGGNANWIHAATLTGQELITMRASSGAQWRPQSTQIEPTAIPNADAPEATAARRLRQMKELARRFTAHEFWDPDNSRYEMRLLVQPIHRYRDETRKIVDGAIFALAHGTNPEVLVLIEAIGPKLESARMHYSLARLGSAELHVELDGREVWRRERTPGVVGQPSDPYWLFLAPADQSTTKSPNSTP